MKPLTEKQLQHLKEKCCRNIIHGEEAPTLTSHELLNILQETEELREVVHPLKRLTREHGASVMIASADKNCLTPNCTGKHSARGLCSRCYGWLMPLIRSGEKSEDELITAGRLLPAHESMRESERESTILVANAQTNWRQVPITGCSLEHALRNAADRFPPAGY